jgi:hypothetical protein
VLVGAVLLLTSCGSTSTTAPLASRPATAPSPASSSAQPAAAPSARDAVIGYIRALNAHDVAAVRTYLAPEYQQERAAAIPRFEDWVANVASVRLRPMPPGISPTGLEGQNPGYRDLIEFGASYDIAFRTESAHDMETSGPQTRFFVVGRSRTRGTWLIIGIGTGP